MSEDLTQNSPLLQKYPNLKREFEALKDLIEHASRPQINVVASGTHTPDSSEWMLRSYHGQEARLMFTLSAGWSICPLPGEEMPPYFQGIDLVDWAISNGITLYEISVFPMREELDSCLEDVKQTEEEILEHLDPKQANIYRQILHQHWSNVEMKLFLIARILEENS